MRAGFAGVGAMGAAMAGRALEDGLEVEVFDISEAATAAPPPMVDPRAVKYPLKKFPLTVSLECSNSHH